MNDRHARKEEGKEKEENKHFFQSYQTPKEYQKAIFHL